MRLLVFLTFLAFGATAQAGEAPFRADPGPYAVETLLGEWVDDARNGRAVPWKIYFAPDAPGARPAVIFSHGLGGSREGSAFLGTFLAAHGFVAVHIQHPGSDESLWAGETDRAAIIETLRASLRDLESAENRFRDVPFVIDRLEIMAQSGPLTGRMDLSRLGMSGHSYGAVSTLVAAGQRLGPRGRYAFREARIDAAIAYSPNKPRRGVSDAARTYGDISIPIFHMTGTHDGSPLEPDMDPADRLFPFQNIQGARQYLLVLEGGDHMVFSGRDPVAGRSVSPDRYPRYHDIICQGSLAFWEATLNNDAQAKAWLEGGAFARYVAGDGAFDFRN